MVIDLDRITENARLIRRSIPPEVKMLGVVKADAYGHGAAEVSRCLLREGACMLAVAIPEEALALREAGVSCPILVLGGADGDLFGPCVEAGVSMAVFTEDALLRLDRVAARLGRPALCHLKYDTGMTRIGATDEDALGKLLDVWRSLKNVRMEGFFTHFCAADSDADFTRAQNDRFVRGLAMARKAGFSPVAHAASSSAMLLPGYRHDMVRAGIALYGSCAPALPVRGAQTLRTRPVRVAAVPAGATVGYGRTRRLDRDSVIMTLPIGYGDGYPRALSNKGDVLIRGRRAPIVGSVCMDMLMADVTDVPGACVSDEVVLLGEQGSERISADELADLTGTIPYEIMLGFLPRIRRIYQGGNAQ